MMTRSLRAFLFYALLHLLSRPERQHFLEACFRQLSPAGYMIFTVISTDSELYGRGTLISGNRYKLPDGLKVFFYDEVSVRKEFGRIGLIDYRPFNEPVKHHKDAQPIRLWLVICRKGKA